MNFSIEQLVTFVAVYEESSFSKAAASLNKHRTTASQVISNLEDLLAVTLFERDARSVRPTEEGELLYHYAKVAIEQTNIFDQIALSLASGRNETINFAYSSLIPHGALSQIRKQLAVDFPTLRVNYIVRNQQEIEDGIVNGEFHFGLVNVDRSRGVYNKDVTFVGNIQFLPFTKKGGTLTQVPKNRLAATMRTTRQFVLTSFIEEGLGKRVILSANNEQIDQMSLVIKLLQEDLGWAWLPRVLSESPYITEHLEPLQINEMKFGMRFGFSLWNPHTKHVLVIKNSVIKAIDDYIAKFDALER
ncbi:LysR family transcriptional regulator [Vibrio sp. D404a]|uniref:LysR family transcriptional regulator n=1 Tax=unclassified Vibrio TaxID=2614977 RepID=UPI002553B13F|nr:MULTISPECIES: LysR family transcriptional regulator [unclassified Vibrio]MDK9735678.1 LysR family transcriptional regulator [Vibrio sp. D404a]MDK9798594.1 LysR family transcriptional regulator [Vibrio sp. D449a]